MSPHVDQPTMEQRALFAEILAATQRVPPAQKPCFIIKRLASGDRVLRHPVLLSIEIRVDLADLIALHERELIGIGTNDEGSAFVWVEPRVLEALERRTRLGLST